MIIKCVNFQQTYGECIEVLAAICQTISLATLTLCFPAPKLWQSDSIQENANDYVSYYLSKFSNYLLNTKLFIDVYRPAIPSRPTSNTYFRYFEFDTKTIV